MIVFDYKKIKLTLSRKDVAIHGKNEIYLQNRIVVGQSFIILSKHRLGGIDLYFEEITEWYQREYLPKFQQYVMESQQIQIDMKNTTHTATKNNIFNKQNKENYDTSIIIQNNIDKIDRHENLNLSDNMEIALLSSSEF